MDFKIRTVVIDGLRVKLQIWDTAGQERFRTITSTYYRGTHGVIIVYDVTNGDSFANVRRWLEEIQNNCDVVNKVLGEVNAAGSAATICLLGILCITYSLSLSLAVGNKNDDPDRKVVITEDAQRFARQMDIELFETSAKDNLNVEDMFLSITRQVLNHKLRHAQDEQQKDRIIVTNKKGNRKQNKCCS